MKKRIAAMVMSAALVAGTLAGCASTSASADSAAPAAGDTQAAETASGDNVTLRFAWWGGDERNAATQAVIEQFEAAHPGVTIEGEPGSSDGYHDKLATQLASGTAADIVQIDPETMPTFVNSGDYFVDLKTTSIDLSTFDAEYIGARINGNYNDKQLGLPTGVAGPAILVNKDLADQFGIDMAKADITWEDWIEMGKTVHEQDPEVYLFCANKEYITNLVVLPMAKQLTGGEVFNEEGKLVLTEDQAAQILSYVKDLYDNNVVAPASYQASYVADDVQPCL